MRFGPCADPIQRHTGLKAGMSKLRALTGWFEHPMETVTCLASINAVSTFILCGGGKF